MKKQLKWTSLILTVGLLAGCSTTGLSPREHGPNRYTQLVYSFCEQQDKTAGEPEPIHTPMRLGVAQIGETAPPGELINELKMHRSLIREVTPLPLPGDIETRWNYRNTNEPDESEKIRRQAETLRTLGQQLETDYILVIGGNIDSSVESRPTEILDLAILPGMIIPSQKIIMNARAGGAFINVKTGQLEFLLTTTSEATDNCPSFYVDQEREKMAVAQRTVLCKQLSDELVTKLINTH